MNNFKKEIDFSVVIPTLNRAHLVNHGIISALKQKGVLVEVIVLDDCSTDDTERKVRELKDKRIKYFKNKERLGYALNLKKCFYKSTGHYIFTLGDDDFILEDNALLNILKVMKKYKTALGRIGSITFANHPKTPVRVYDNSNELVVLKPRKNQHLLIKALDLNLASFSGLIFNNYLIDKSLFINQINYPYYPMVLEAIKKFGIVYIPDYFTVNGLSYQMVPTYVNLEKHGGFYLLDLLNIIKKFIDNRDYNLYKKKVIRDIVVMLPTIKLYSDNRNVLSIVKILINIDPSLVFNIKSHALFFLSLMPKFLIKSIRFVAIYLSERKIVETVEKYHYYSKLGKWDFIKDYENK